MQRANPAISPALTFSHFYSGTVAVFMACNVNSLRLKTELKYQADKSQYKEIVLKLFKNILH